MIARLLIAAAFVAALVFGSFAMADGYPNGFAVDGYTFHNGYWWRDGHAFTRARVLVSAHGNCRTYRWSYSPYVATAKAAASSSSSSSYITPDTEDWRAKMLEIVHSQIKYESSLRASANEHNEFLETAAALGIKAGYGYGDGPGLASIDRSNPVALSGALGYGYGVGSSNFGYSQLPAAQGSTVYGYNETIADVYGNVDLNAIYNTAARLREQSRGYEAQGEAGHQELIDNLGDRAAGLMSQRLAIAEIQAKATGVATMAQALTETIRAEGRLHIEQRSGAGGEAPPPAPDENSVSAIFTRKCVSCHGGDKKEAGLDLTSVEGIDVTTVEKILTRITSRDKPMPPEGADPLTSEELRAIFEAAKVINR